MSKTSRVTHAFEPVYDLCSRVLLLGTMPSPLSRENGFYYSHPQNRFWKIIGTLLGEEPPQTPEQKKCFILSHHIALWDVLASCDIVGASDSSIKNPRPNDLRIIIDNAPIRAVFFTGKKAEQLYIRLCEPIKGIPVACLPSTSPANRRYSDEALLQHYAAILPYLHETSNIYNQR